MGSLWPVRSVLGGGVWLHIAIRVHALGQPVRSLAGRAAGQAGAFQGGLCRDAGCMAGLAFSGLVSGGGRAVGLVLG